MEFFIQDWIVHCDVHIFYSNKDNRKGFLEEIHNGPIQSISIHIHKFKNFKKKKTFNRIL